MKNKRRLWFTAVNIGIIAAVICGMRFLSSKKHDTSEKPTLLCE